MYLKYLQPILTLILPVRNVTLLQTPLYTRILCLVVIGDFNEKVGRQQKVDGAAFEQFRFGERNEIGTRLV